MYFADPSCVEECTPVGNIRVEWACAATIGSLDHPTFAPTTHLFTFWEGWGPAGQIDLVHLINKSKTLVVS